MRITRLSEGDGSGPELVCLPGAMCPPQVFERAAHLSGLAAIGLGWLEDEGGHDLESIAARVRSAIVGLPSVILVGHSLGTPIAMLVALQEARAGSTRVQGLVLANSGANTRGHGDSAKLVERIRHDWSEAFWEAFIARCFRTLPAGPLLDELRAYPQRLDRYAVIEAILSQQTMDFAPMLQALPRVPTAIVHGQHDPARTLAHAHEMVSGIAGATLHVMDTGHTSCAEDPVGFARILQAVAH
ncbi:alpha/beta hydrolase [Pseudomonas sp. dw_358]|uniref:alpha/beta fold hydrolase n=1 Tax=Pseudomonas sp. dw_358 TaxID=2720083 RepID=UPI001BD51D33|nr:alpha/beta hydrolase [Pseudomonas sp. dw_358]